MGFLCRFFCIGTALLHAQTELATSALVRVEPREVLVLTSTRQTDRNAPHTDHAHELLQLPLNYLGMRVRHCNVLDPDPPPFDPAVTRAVITWLQGDEELPAWVWPWLERRAVEDVRVIHLGSLDPFARSERGGRLARWLRRFGLSWDDGLLEDSSRIAVQFEDPRLSCFESRPVYQRLHLGPRNDSDRNRVWTTSRDRRAVDDRRAPVVTGDWGGIALQPWLLRLGGGEHDRRWYVDPFAFLATALALDRVPAPDPSVLNGRRMFVLHVDGDGFESVSTVARGQLSGEVFLREVIDRYRLPMTVSVIVASLTDDLEIVEPTAAMGVAREILNRPWVEPASHSVLHPLDWRRKHTPRTLPRSVNWYDHLANYRHDMVAEVRESVRFVNERLLVDGRRCAVMLWSGAANPDEAALLEAERIGCWNMNGGVFRWDDLYASVGFVSPWGKTVGRAFQVYCGAANENVFDGFFTTMPTAFRHIGRTLENTGRPRILKPANLYVHFYSAERPARLRVLHDLIDRWAYREPTAPVFASTYARAVSSAQLACRIDRMPEGWAFRDFGDCRTVRIDGETRMVDWSRSSGLLGARHVDGRLFLHLAAPDAEVVLSDDASPWPHVEQANHPIEEARLSSDGVELRAVGLGRREIVFAGLRPFAELQLSLDGALREEHSDADGRLQLRLEPETTEVVLRRR